jgi:prepilin-type processing-associated H-X9-DG protein
MRAYAIDDVRSGAFPRTYYAQGPTGTISSPANFPGARVGRQVATGTAYLAGTSVGAASANLGDPLADPFRAPPPATNPDFRPRENSVTAAFYHLMRQSDLVPEVFTCPSSAAEPVIFAGGRGKSAFIDWAQPVLNNSYSFFQMYPDVEAYGRGFKWTDSLPSTYAVAADMNPGRSVNAVTGTTTDSVTAVSTNSSNKEMRLGNSNNHNKEGQNVLFADGSVRFVTTPFEGPFRDNIYTAQDRTLLAIVGGGVRFDQPGRLFFGEPGDGSATGNDQPFEHGATQATSYPSPGTGNDCFLVPTDDWLDDPAI